MQGDRNECKNDLIPDVECEEVIKKSLNFLEYPAVTLTRGQSRTFYFNCAATSILCGPYIKVSKGLIDGEQVLCFRNSKDCRNFKLMHHPFGSAICALGILNFIGLRCSAYDFRGRHCVRIKDGLAVKMYEEPCSYEAAAYGNAV